MKIRLAFFIRNISDWPRFLTLEVYAFSAHIYLFDLAVSWPLQFFYTNSFSFQFSIQIFLSPCSKFSTSFSTEIVGSAVEIVFNMKMSRAASLLNF